MNNHQVPATKPLFLKNSKPIISSNPSAALQGATSAFLPQSAGTTTSLSPTTAIPSSGARYAALAAGTHTQRIVGSRPVNHSNGVPNERSPERGRPIQPAREFIQDAARSATSNNSRLAPSKPTFIERSPSTIAARHASSHSASPHRSPKRSPHRTLGRTTSGLSGQSRDVQAMSSEETASLSSSLPGQDFTPVRARLLNFEKLPSLNSTQGTTPQKAQISPQHSFRMTMSDNTSKQLHKTDTSISRYRTQNASNSPAAQSSLTRGSSDVSTTTLISESDGGYQKRMEINHSRPKMPIRYTTGLKRTSPHSTSSDIHSGMTLSSLADAMVGASLASSRAASPSKKPTPLASRRRSRSFSALSELMASYELNDEKKHRKPLKPLRSKPQRPMKQTLRKPSASDDDEPVMVKRGRKHWMRKHPNMHHEGDRKRWRDTVTESERRRYEGVFAANRGLLIGPGYFEPSPSALSDLTAEGNKVANVIVRELWERSRLPGEILREVYDLVSPEEEQALGRDQFVVGMWLIDQRLKGRKLPVKVSHSVWGSVRHPDGIKLRSK